MQGGWIKIHRDIMSWEWWDDAKMVKAWLTILMLANSEDKKWHGKTVKAGSFVTSRAKLATDLKLTEKQTRLVLSRLISTGEITTRTNNHNTTIIINNWADYQLTKDQQMGQPDLFDNQQNITDFKEYGADKGPTKGQPNADKGPTKGHKQEIKEYRVSKETLSPGAPAGACPRVSVLPFDDFWNLYGKKVDRAASERAYARIPERDRAKIKEHVPRYVAATPEVRYRKNPTTYLHGKCWNDEIITDDAQGNPNVMTEYHFEPDESGTQKPSWEVDLDEIE